MQSLWHEAVDIVLSPLRNLDEGTGIMIDCADGLRRECFPIVAAWLADYQEHAIICQIKQGRCPLCEVTVEGLSHELKDDDKRIHRSNPRDVETYRMLSHTVTGRVELIEKGVSNFTNAL
jgi:hypothetical protein